ncbi:MAG: YgiT-type zinc finger protein [Selenomonadaceae bacterium]|nr:YgiT-type zinc finger protein [Selenomonadaceae bacterium]
MNETVCGTCGGRSVMTTTTYKWITAGNEVIVIHDVPCYRCSQCGEELFLFSTLDKLDEIKQEAKTSREISYAA